MKAADLMRAMESRPDALEAAAPSLHGSDRKPDISDVLGRIRGGQTQPDFQAPAPKIVQTKHSRLVPAMLTACSIAACAAVVTGLAFLIRDSHEAVESSDAAMLIPAGTEEADADIAAEPVTEQSAEIAESEAEAAPQTEPTDGAEAQNDLVVTAETEPVSGTVKSEAQPAPNTEPADAEAPLVTAKTVPTTAVLQQNDETIVRITYKIPNLSVLMPGMIRIELYDYADGKKISGFDLFSGEPGGDSGLVEVVIPDGTTHIIAAMYCDETNKKAEIGTFPVKVQNGAAEPIKMHIFSALNEVCTVTESPAISQPVFRTLEKDHTLPAPSFIYQWNSDQYHALDTELHYESAAEWKNNRMMGGGDWALYAEHNDGFRYLDEHADSVSYLWFMYEADGAVPEVRQMEISDQSGIWIKAALCPADVHGKVRVMIPLDEEVPAWIGDVTDQWRLELVENGVFKHDPIQTHWYMRIDETSGIAPVY